MECGGEEVNPKAGKDARQGSGSRKKVKALPVPIFYAGRGERKPPLKKGVNLSRKYDCGMTGFLMGLVNLCKSLCFMVELVGIEPTTS